MLSAYDAMSATQQAQSELFGLRVADHGDRAYVLKSWFEGARETRWAKEAWYAFWIEHGSVLEAILDRAVTRIAHVSGEPTAILGFAVLEPDAAPPVLHWVHVRHRCRGQGIARALLQPIIKCDVVYCSHWVPTSRLPPMFRYNPYCLFDRGHK